jgi:hypothetical protein
MKINPLFLVSMLNGFPNYEPLQFNLNNSNDQDALARANVKIEKARQERLAKKNKRLTIR